MFFFLVEKAKSRIKYRIVSSYEDNGPLNNNMAEHECLAIELPQCDFNYMTKF